jgi:hypothetical protein
MRRAPAAPGLGVVPLIAVVAAVAAAAVALRRERWLLLLRR